MTKINNVRVLEQDVRHAIKQFKSIEKHFSAKERRNVLTSGARALVLAVRSKIPEAKEDVKRYSTPKVKKKQRAPKGMGKVIAVYTPGNARRSYGILPLRRSAEVYVGPKVSKGSSGGVFTGTRVDGYYFHMLEYGTRFIPALAPIRRGLTEAKGIINERLRKGFEKHTKSWVAKNAKR